MIEVTVTGRLAGYEERAEAPDCESALVAARTLWQDAQDVTAPFYNACVTTFSLDGVTLMRIEGRPS